jgi:predicted nuclease of predicted toxin-antitoxin system
MRILFDHNTPLPLRYSLGGYTTETTADHGWQRFTNGELLDSAEAAGFDILLTADKGFLRQQNLSQRRIAIVILSRGNWPDVKMNIPKVLEALSNAKRGTCTLVEWQTTLGPVVREEGASHA